MQFSFAIIDDNLPFAERFRRAISQRISSFFIEDIVLLPCAHLRDEQTIVKFLREQEEKLKVVIINANLKLSTFDRRITYIGLKLYEEIILSTGEAANFRVIILSFDSLRKVRKAYRGCPVLFMRLPFRLSELKNVLTKARSEISEEERLCRIQLRKEILRQRVGQALGEICHDEYINKAGPCMANIAEFVSTSGIKNINGIVEKLESRWWILLKEKIQRLHPLLKSLGLSDELRQIESALNEFNIYAMCIRDMSISFAEFSDNQIEEIRQASKKIHLTIINSVGDNLKEIRKKIANEGSNTDAEDTSN